MVLCQEEGKGVFIRFLKIAIIPLVVEVSWLLNCLVKRRVAKLTGAGIKMAVSGVVPNVDYRMELVKKYFQGFIMEPIHRQNTIGIDLSVLIYILLAMILIVFYEKQKMISKKEKNFLIIFFLLMAIISYGITLVAHLTIFVTELQYLEAKVMTASSMPGSSMIFFSIFAAQLAQPRFSIMYIFLDIKILLLLFIVSI
mgnify:CR=1 FL=1